MQRDLVLRAKDGDADAFTELVRVSAPRLRGVANLILRDPDRAKDAVQEAFIAAWKDLRALRDPDAWDAWLRRLTVRTCYRLAKRERRRVEIEGQVRPMNDMADPGQQNALRDELERGFARLPVEQRTVLVLHHYVGYSFPEIAVALGIPVGTAKSRVHRATLAMRAALRADAETPQVSGGQSA